MGGFDAADSEDAPVTFPLAGRDWTLPPVSAAPARVLLRMERLLLQVADAEKTGRVPDDFVMDDTLSTEGVARALAGDDVVDAWLDHGVGFAAFRRATMRLAQIYRGGDDPGEAPPPANRGTRRKSSKRKGSASKTS